MQSLGLVRQEEWTRDKEPGLRKRQDWNSPGLEQPYFGGTNFEENQEKSPCAWEPPPFHNMEYNPKCLSFMIPLLSATLWNPLANCVSHTTVVQRGFRPTFSIHHCISSNDGDLCNDSKGFKLVDERYECEYAASFWSFSSFWFFVCLYKIRKLQAKLEWLVFNYMGTQHYCRRIII